MANKVFANGREISCKAAKGKTICAMPDVCFTPPENPATPPGVPIPYPNTGMASDTTNGSKSVKITDKEVGLKNKSCFKTSTGDEAGCAAKKGVITSTNTGKVYFKSWSMNVKIEGENAVRHLDLTTNNHKCEPGDTPTWPYTDRMAMADQGDCEKDMKKVEDNCKVNEDGKVECPKNEALIEANKEVKGKEKNEKVKKAREDYAADTKNDACEAAAKCLLSPYSPSKCCDPETPHHLVPKASFFTTPFDQTGQVKFVRSMFKPTKIQQTLGVKNKQPGAKAYDYKKAPCICCSGGAQSGTHGLLHDAQSDHAKNRKPGEPWTLDDAIDSAADAVADVFPDSDCDPECIKAQLRRGGHEGVDGTTEIDRSPAAKTAPKDISSFKDRFKKAAAAIFKKATESGMAD